MTSTGSATRVLIVEDSASDRALLKATIDSLGGDASIETIDAASLGEAFRVLGERGADMILLDLGLPDSHGLDTLRRMRGRIDHVPIIVFTSLYTQEKGLEAVEIGAQDFLVKGDTTGETLAHAIHCALARHHSPEHQASASVDRELDALNRVRDSLRPPRDK